MPPPSLTKVAALVPSEAKITVCSPVAGMDIPVLSALLVPAPVMAVPIAGLAADPLTLSVTTPVLQTMQALEAAALKSSRAIVDRQR